MSDASSIFPPDPNWIRTRTRVLKQIKAQVRGWQGPESTEILAFMRRFEKDLRVPWRVSNKAALLRAVDRADIIYGGDFHAFAQAQRTHLKILTHRTTRRPLLLGIEAVDARYQRHLDAYVEGRLDEREVVRAVHWRRDWGFPWEHYRPLFEFARRGGHRLVALGSGSAVRSLQEREKLAAERIALALREKTRSGRARPQMYIIFGELHLARGHLPLQVRKALPPGARRELIIHLNPERLYFELARQGREAAVEVLRLAPDLFCVLASPPWVQWQSYLMYLEKAHDPDLGGDEADNHFAFDHTEQVGGLLKIAAADLGLALKANDLAVFSAADGRLWMNLKNFLSARELTVARQLIESGRSFFVPRGGLAYLSRPTVNHAAELAGQYVHSRLCGRRRTLWRFPDDFEALVWTEAVGFFFSKLINHKRHSETLPDLRARLASLVPQDKGREALLIALEQRLGELLLFHRGRRRRPRLRPRRLTSRLEAARILGGMMGERLYLTYRSRKMSRDTLLDLLRVDPAKPGFDVVYESIVRRLGPGTGAPRTRKERL